MKLLPAAYDLPEPIRPRRCPTRHQPITDEGKWGDCTCGGAGFLYPDPPDWWHKIQANYDYRSILPWERFCDLAWRVLGIVDTE